MNFYTLFGILAIVVSFLLTLVVLVQNSQGGGLSNTFGASNLSSMIGTRRANQDIEKITWYLFTGLVLACFIANANLSAPNANPNAPDFSKKITPQNVSFEQPAGLVPDANLNE